MRRRSDWKGQILSAKGREGKTTFLSAKDAKGREGREGTRKILFHPRHAFAWLRQLKRREGTRKKTNPFLSAKGREGARRDEKENNLLIREEREGTRRIPLWELCTLLFWRRVAGQRIHFTFRFFFGTLVKNCHVCLAMKTPDNLFL